MAWWRRGLLEDLSSNGVGFSQFGMSRWELRRQLTMAVLFFSSIVGLLAIVYFFSGPLIGGLPQAQAQPQPGALPGPGPGPGPIPIPIPSPSPSPNPGLFGFGLNGIFIVPLVGAIVFLGIGLGGSWTIARGRRRALAMGGYACPNCLFDLSGNAVERCGECGQHVMHSALPELWAKQRNWRGIKKKEFWRTGFDTRGLSWVEAKLRRYQVLGGFVFIIPWIGSQYLAEYLETVLGGSYSGWMFPIFVVGLIVIVGPYVMFLLKKSARLKGSLRESGGMSCPRCLHDLSGAEVDRCPECEQFVEYATLGQKWAVRMKVLKIEQGGGDGFDGDVPRV